MMKQSVGYATKHSFLSDLEKSSKKQRFFNQYRPNGERQKWTLTKKRRPKFSKIVPFVQVGDTSQQLS